MNDQITKIGQMPSLTGSQAVCHSCFVGMDTDGVQAAAVGDEEKKQAEIGV